MAADFKDTWSRLLAAKGKPGGGLFDAEYRFDLLEGVIQAFKDKYENADEEGLLARANGRLSTFSLSYAQIVGAAAPFLASESNSTPPPTWHDSLPVGLLVLVTPATFDTVKKVEELAQTAPGELSPHWDALGSLLAVLDRELGKAADTELWGGTWSEWLRVKLALKTNPPDGPARVHLWVTVAAADVSQASWLMPAYRSQGAAEAVAIMATPAKPKELAPKSGMEAVVMVDDPRTLVPASQTNKVKFISAASVELRVALSEPEPDELTIAALMLSRYRLNPGSGVDVEDAVSLWDAALDLDPPSGGVGNVDWDFKRKVFDLRLGKLISRSLPGSGLAAQPEETLISACWARRLSGIAAHGLSYSAPGVNASILPIEHVKEPARTQQLPPENDMDADKWPMPSPVPQILDPLLSAFYLAVRLGASAASARSLNLRVEDAGTGVAGLLLPPEMVYVNVAAKLRARLRSRSTTDAAAEVVRDWIHVARNENASSWRPCVRLSVLALCEGAPALVQIASGAEVADIKVESRNALSTLEASQLGLVKALAAVYANPPVGGLPAFVTSVAANTKAVDGAVAVQVGQVPQVALSPSIDIPSGLRRLLSRGFEDLESLLSRLAQQAKNASVVLRGARDIVRMGRGAFIKRFTNEALALEPALLSRIYSRAWSKTNARAQFIAATRSSDVTSGAAQAPHKPESVDFPDLAHLFGLTDLPTCTWGDSIHGPAAYLVDVLEFLRHRRLVSSSDLGVPSRSALNLLLDRRPDLAEIDLSSENATIEMPFIDLVNEILEQQLLGTSAFLLDGPFDWIPKEGQALSEGFLKSLQTSLQPFGLHLLSPVTSSEVPEREQEPGCVNEEWVVRDATGIAVRVWRHVKKHGRPDPWQARLMPQTTLSASELAAEPQFVERAAYKELASATVPGSYSLPWSLGEAQLRELLALVSVDVQPLLTCAVPDFLLAGDDAWLPRALADLGISQAEGQETIFGSGSDKLLFDPDRDRADDYRLSAFLQRSGLGFHEALELEQTHAMRRVGFRLVAVGSDPCSADSTRIRVVWSNDEGPSLTAKFLRLRKRLGWRTSELDLAFESKDIGKAAFSSRFALRLSEVRELGQRLRLSIRDTLRIFTRLRTTTPRNATASEWASVFLDTRANGADALRDAEALQVLRSLSSPEGRRTSIEQLLAQVGRENAPRIERRLQAMLGAVLQLPSEELNTLTALRHDAAASWKQLDSEMLAQLYGASLLQRACDVSPRALGVMLAMSTGNPFTNPHSALELVEFRDEITAAGLDAQVLGACLVPPPGAASSADTAMSGYSPVTVLERLLALYKALESVKSRGVTALLAQGDASARLAPESWTQFLKDVGSSISTHSTWEERLSLLRESVRRQLPRIQADAVKLRAELVESYRLGGPGDCDCGSNLLADHLEALEALLDEVLPEGLPPLDPFAPGLQHVKLGSDLLHPVVARWIVKVFGPALQWAGLSRDEILVRLSRWLENDAEVTRAGQADVPGLPPEPEIAAELASYLVCHPLERHAAMLDRQTALSAQLSASLAVTPEEAWVLFNATPSGLMDGSSAAQWWLQLKEQTTPAWKGPAVLSLGQLDTDAALSVAFDQIKAISLFARAVAGMKLDTASLSWLYDPAASKDGQCAGQRLKVLVPGDLLGNAPGKPEQLKELAARWRKLFAWSRVFKATPDVAAVDGSSGLVSIRKDVLDVLHEKEEQRTFADDDWALIAGALKRLFGLSSSDATDHLRRLGTSVLLEPQVYVWLEQVDKILVTTGLSALDLEGVAAAISSPDEVERLDLGSRLRSSLRRRFADAAWPEAIRKGQDRLREQKRDALVDALLNKGDARWSNLDRSKDRLYEYLLLDTQMAASMTTSRIVQAHAAVQQFAMRCTMGLEIEWRIPASELVDWGQWKWMGTYRVWEACRKIFLYPENWMEPEVRDDKSRFFEELEADLNQGELTNDNAELAFTRYLHKLHDVSRVSIVATYYEFDPNEPVMHVLGRTLSQPFRYFYRQWVDERRWAPWEPVDLEIESDHIVLFKRGGRLYLGWLMAAHEETRPKLPETFTTKQGTDGTVTVGGIEEPAVRWKLQLATSERSKEGWQAKRTSPSYLLWPAQPVPMSRLARENRVERLQLSFQDFEVPEILLTVFPQDGEPPQVKSSASRQLIGSFSLASCLALANPEPLSDDRLSQLSVYPVVQAAKPQGSRYLERLGANASLRLEEGSGPGSVADAIDSILADPPEGVDPTPGRFAVTLAAQASLLDALIAIARATLVPSSTPLPMTMGLGLPIFYSDDVVDIAIRTKFGKEKAEHVSARQIARTLADLRKAVLSEPVQTKVWSSASSQSTWDDTWAAEVIDAIEKASSSSPVETILTLLEKVTDTYSPESPFELAARTHHPLACELVTRAEGRGIASVFSGRVQEMRREEVYRGRTQTQLSKQAIERFPVYGLSFEQSRDAYACYNWETFYHAPFMVAMKFAAEGKFEDAVRWFNYIFDPIGVDDAVATPGAEQRRQFWRTQPFRAAIDGSINPHNVDVLLDPSKWGSEVRQEALQDLADSIMAWRRRPNLPFQVARGRWISFQKAVVYRYIDTLIAWADARFRIDTREEITAASQLYVLAARLLGRRPRSDISMCDRDAAQGCGAKSYEQLQALIDRRDDELSKYLDTLLGDVEDILDCTENEEPDSPHLNFYNEYFCIPPNEKLFDLWDRIADRLYKVRNCLNIDGVFRSLSLFAPPIDPALLARAGAAGLSFDQIMTGLNQPRAHYRFSVMLQKANEVASELRVLGGELLQALEKRDAEEMATLRSRLDLQAIRLNKDIRDEQIREAKTQLEAVITQINTVKARQGWYLARIDRGTSAKELESIDGIRSGLLVRTRVAAMKSTAAIASMIPEFTVGANGAFGSPHFALKISGQPIAFAQNFFADKLAVEGDKDQTAAGITATLASYERRLEDWQFQRDMASGELLSLEKQRIASEIRLTMALAEKRNLERSIESSETTDAFLKSKFTNTGLYDWMVRQVSTVYYKTYQLAAEYARAAEDCLNRELPASQSGVKVVRSDHWNGLRKGLLAASSLIHDLKRLESEHIKRNKRVPELMKHVSLAVVDPRQLLELRATGRCSFKVPEVLFDMDHPGQCMRRIKSVALSVQCITGPYAGVSCRLSLLRSEIRKPDQEKPERVLGPAEAIFSSTANNDAGLWEPNLRDERYLPFEGAGAINSEWRLDLPNMVRLFDYATISDVVLHIRYTAEPGADPVQADKDLAMKLQDAVEMGGSIWVYSSLRSDLADQFAALGRDSGGPPIRLKMPRELMRWNGQPVRPTGQVVFAILGEGGDAPTVSFNGEKLVGLKALNEKRSFWRVETEVKDPEEALGGAGFELSVTGLTQLRDVIIYAEAIAGL
ncbi:neuraminidase-like domain-containing protein [Pelomonas sp. SE-A7]|uniref:Tc toxin subunit A-related protein n=1 Tax=Pelomonas sp. SE-A7 TaxID=3054953 RepID=UPI00259CEA2E|nr:neuraminidase-like domain-containing protein [Pelomonas sp. SE-A7]MDM4766660.1 neuraminidase-like domain-containing protein [Pelomonas sp. SE-A7]